jgi:adenine phosphoribosyltransferase
MDNEEITKRLMETFRDIPVVNKKGYHYFVHPLSDGIPSIEPELLTDASILISEIITGMEDIDLLLTAESMGIPITTSISSKLGIPFSIARKRHYGLPGEIKVDQSTGYSTSTLYLDLPIPGKNLIIIDDVLSTGGTMRSLVRGISRTDWEIVGAVILFNKMGDLRSDLSTDMGFPILSILDIDVHSNGIEVSISSNSK